MPNCWSVVKFQYGVLSHLLSRSTRSLSKIVHGQLICRAGSPAHLSIEIKHTPPAPNQVSERSSVFVLLFVLGFMLLVLVLHLHHASCSLAECGPVSISTFCFPGFSSILDQIYTDNSRIPDGAPYTNLPSVLPSFYFTLRKKP